MKYLIVLLFCFCCSKVAVGYELQIHAQGVYIGNQTKKTLEVDVSIDKKKKCHLEIKPSQRAYIFTKGQFDSKVYIWSPGVSGKMRILAVGVQDYENKVIPTYSFTNGENASLTLYQKKFQPKLFVEVSNNTKEIILYNYKWKH